MPLDDDMLLRTGAVDLDNSEAVAVSETANADGAKVLDIRKTGAKGMVAVMNLPDAPTTYADTLAAVIQASDYVSTDFKTIASFPTLYALNRRLRVVSTTAFVAADIGQTQLGGDTGDQGVLRWYDRALETVGGEGDLIVSMLAVPALAGVVVDCNITDTNLVTVTYSAGDANLPRAFGLDIIADANISMVDVNDSDYYIYPSSIDVNDDTGDVDDYGSPVVSLDANVMTIEMGSLYASNDPDHNTAPAASGWLI